MEHTVERTKVARRTESYDGLLLNWLEILEGISLTELDRPS